MRKKDVLAAFFYLTLSTALMLIWFKDGLMYGGGDVGLATYNPTRILEIIKYVWWEALAPGSLVAPGITGLPIYFLLSFLQRIGLSFVAIQTFLFGTLFFLMGIGMYFVGKTVFGKKSFVLPFLSGLVYVFSPYIMISVWHRFVHTAFYLAASLPFIYLAWISWIKHGSKKGIVTFAAMGVVGAAVFSTLGFLVTTWILLGFYSFFEIFFSNNDFVDKLGYIRRSLAGIFIWIGVSLWWMLPVFTSVPALFSQQHSVLESVTTLEALSEQSKIPYTIQGINPFYLFEEKDWGKIYSNVLFKSIPWTIVLVSFSGFVYGLVKKRYLFWSFLLIFSLFLAKGAAPPFGEIYTWAFTKSFLLGAIRNPFEKLGILIPFSHALTVPIGILLFKKIISTKWFKFIFIPLLLFGLLLNFAVWDWPYWKGVVFGDLNNSAKVEVPKYYDEADSWLKTQTDEGRILHLPLTVGEATGFNWEHGYRGVEPSQLLFTSYPSISRGINLFYVDDALETLQIAMSGDIEFSEEQIRELLDIFGVKYIVVHFDAVSTEEGINSPEESMELVENMSFVEKREEFGKLAIYEVNNSLSQDLIYASGSYDLLEIGEDNSIWPWQLKDSDLFLTTVESERFVSGANSHIIVFSDRFNTAPGVIANKENLLNEMPTVRFLPDNPLYTLVKIKEKLETLSVFGKERLVKKINLSSKRLVEAVEIKSKNRKYPIEPLLVEYRETIQGITPFLSDSLALERGSLEGIFARQLLALEELKELTTGKERELLEEITKDVRRDFSKMSLIPAYVQTEEEGFSRFDRSVYTFNVNRSGDYEIFLPMTNGGLRDDALNLQVDDQVIERAGRRTGAFISYGTIYLEEGYHEITYGNKRDEIVLPRLNNWTRSETGKAYSSDEGLTIESDRHEASHLTVSLPAPSLYEEYTLDFEYWVQNGNGPNIEVLHDNDPFQDGERKLKVDKNFGSDLYERHWLPASISFEPRKTAREVKLRLVVESWNDCEFIAPQKKLCDNEEYKRNFERPSKVVFRNVRLRRGLQIPIYLKMQSEKAGDKGITKAEYERLSPVSFKGSIELTEPSVLVLSETFDPNWKIDLEKVGSGDKKTDKVLTNSFGNGWYIDEPGKYSFTIYYEPQRRAYLGTLIGVVVIGGLIWYLKRRK